MIDSQGDLTANSLRQNLVQQLGVLVKLLGTVLPAIQSTATSASAGSVALPSAPAGFLVVTNPATGQPVKIAYYNP